MHVVTVFMVTCQVVREHRAVLLFVAKDCNLSTGAISNISNKTVLTSIQFACQSVLFNWKLGYPRRCHD